MMDNKKQQILSFIQKMGACSSKEIFDGLDLSLSYATLKRLLTNLFAEKYIYKLGQGKGTKYAISPIYKLICPIDSDQYFKNEIDDREIIDGFNFEIITEVFANNNVLNDNDLIRLNELQSFFLTNITSLKESEFKKEFERLAIDLSWKSSQIEGNTYSLLETEKLIIDKQTASGKTKEEAIMLLNHKDALDFILENRDYFNPISISKIEDIHSILVKDLDVERNIRKKRVGILGTNYRPLDNEFQIIEALNFACSIINNKDNVFEKAFLALILISYIQPFMDGNKRTARIISNAILMSENYCPLTYRTVDSIDYKKAILLFYEQNNISKMKEIFIEQYQFAVKTYF
jgi:predicted nucleic acid-binding protein